MLASCQLREAQASVDSRAGSRAGLNWLPAPNGPIYMVVRLYWPKTEPPSLLPAGEDTWQPPGLVQVK